MGSVTPVQNAVSPFSASHPSLPPILPPSTPQDSSEFPVLSPLTSSTKPRGTCWSPTALYWLRQWLADVGSCSQSAYSLDSALDISGLLSPFRSERLCSELIPAPWRSWFLYCRLFQFGGFYFSCLFWGSLHIYKILLTFSTLLNVAQRPTLWGIRIICLLPRCTERRIYYANKF